MAPSLNLKHYLGAPFPLVFCLFSFLFFFLFVAESRPLRPADDRAPALESVRGIIELDSVRPVRSNVHFSYQVLYFHSSIDEDFDGDDEDISSACLEICYLLLPTDLCEILAPEIKVGKVQRGIVLFLFERPPPSVFHESLDAC
jgi:hypothetical protein